MLPDLVSYNDVLPDLVSYNDAPGTPRHSAIQRYTCSYVSLDALQGPCESLGTSQALAYGGDCCAAGGRAAYRAVWACCDRAGGCCRAQALQNTEVLKQQEVIKSIQNVLQTNVSVCTSLGQPFVTQMNFIFNDMLQVGGQGCVLHSA